MNTINQYQVFCPIPFVEFHPDIAHINDIKQVDTDINRNHGRYDEYNYNNIAFYVKDYNASMCLCRIHFHFTNCSIEHINFNDYIHMFVIVRKAAEFSIPIIHSDRDISSLLKLSQDIPVTSLFEMFVSFSNLHVLRAVEPALKVKYKNINCTSAYNNNIYKLCVRSRSFHLGRRSQLARLVLDYQTYKNNLLV